MTTLSQSPDRTESVETSSTLLEQIECIAESLLQNPQSPTGYIALEQAIVDWTETATVLNLRELNAAYLAAVHKCLKKERFLHEPDEYLAKRNIMIGQLRTVLIDALFKSLNQLKSEESPMAEAAVQNSPSRYVVEDEVKKIRTSEGLELDQVSKYILAGIP